MPHESFLHFFWAWRALFGGLVATLSFPLPPARVYHTVSTGYAGLLAARATVETGRPAIITEHGIYTNERRIEILQADWIVDTVDKGFAIHDPRRDLRDFWSARVRKLRQGLLPGMRGGHHAARRQPVGADGARRRDRADEDHPQWGRLPDAQPLAADKRGRSADGRIGRARGSDQGHQDLSAGHQGVAPAISRPRRPGDGADRRATGLLPGVPGDGRGARLVRHRALHRSGRRHAIFPAHPRERPDQPQQVAAVERAGGRRRRRFRLSPPTSARAAKSCSAGATSIRRWATAAS